MRTRLLAVTAAGTGAVLALGGCSLLHSSPHAAASAPATEVAAAVKTSGPGSYSPLSGPVEAASALPHKCSAMLTPAQLENVFGAGVADGTEYASYAALPGIDRTGRVACIFGVGTDSFGRQSTGAVEIAIATYDTAAEAVSRITDTARQDAENGATAAQISVGGHPATLIVEPQTVAATSSATATASASPAASDGALASASADATASGGETELLLADGNRTFVLQIPFGELNSTQAATVLTQLALFVYRNTLPGAGSTATQSPSTG